MKHTITDIALRLDATVDEVIEASGLMLVDLERAAIDAGRCPITQRLSSPVVDEKDIARIERGITACRAEMAALG